MVYVPRIAEIKVAKEAERYRRFRKARARLAKMAQESLEVIDELERVLTTSERIGGKNGKGPRAAKKQSGKKR
jgi:hypothetical protein